MQKIRTINFEIIKIQFIIHICIILTKIEYYIYMYTS